MKSVNDYYYICKSGHLTVGNSNRKAKCDQKIRECKLVKKGRGSVEKEVIKETTCNEEIVRIEEIPKELDYFDVWSSELIRAFLTDQPGFATREGFLKDIQKIMTAIKTEHLSLRKDIEEIRKKWQ